MDNEIRCNECRRCVWDPVGCGYVLYCYGNDIEVRLHKSQREGFLIKECTIAVTREDDPNMEGDILDKAHRQYAGMPKRQSRLDMF